MTTKTMEKPQTTVKLSDLVPDRCNYKDRKFEAFVDRFMKDYMPGFNLGMLDTKDYERWEIEPEYSVQENLTEYEVICVKHEVQQNADLPIDYEYEYQVVDAGDGGHDSTYDDEDEAEAQAEELNTANKWMVVDSDGDWVEFFESRTAAEDDVAERNQPMGFPWAWNWVNVPKSNIKTEDLKAAGFTVALYTGGDGDYRENSQHRVCGIDGGGYSFSGQHYAKLCALAYERWNCRVDTDKGSFHIKAGG